MAVQLENGANQILEFVALLRDQEQVVANCIVNYADPGSGCLDKISWAASRIWNAIKAIFGMSDWQMATEILKNRTYEKIGGRIDVKTLIGNSKLRLESEVTEFASYGLNKILDTYNDNVPPTADKDQISAYSTGLVRGIDLCTQEYFEQRIAPVIQELSPVLE